jgi:lipopolysaccharide export system permease protein
MYDVMIFDTMQGSGFRQVITAKTASIIDTSIIMRDAMIARFKPSGLVDGETVGQTITVGLPAGEGMEQFLNSGTNDAYTLNSKQLSDQVKAMEATGQGGNALGILKVTLAQKFAFPFASLIAVLVALPLAVGVGKKGKTLGVGLSVLLLFIYYLLVAMSAAIGRNGAMNPYVAAWLPNILMTIVGVGLLAREEK